MERNYDEVIADMLIQLEAVERRIEKGEKRIDLTIKRMVKAESRLEIIEKTTASLERKLDEFIENQKMFNLELLQRLDELRR